MIYPISFHCYFADGGIVKHTQDMRLEDIPRWIEAYRFTHPRVEAISCKVWFKGVRG